MNAISDIDALPSVPNMPVDPGAVFGVEPGFAVHAFPFPTPHVPRVDPAYRFHGPTTLAILAGFAANRRVIVHGLHGTGKSTHLEQVAARLNWPCIRVNLDSHISRIDLVGKDAIVLRDGKQVTDFREGILPWSLQRPVALVFDEYDAGRPDVMFVIQRLLEAEGRMTLLDQNRVLDPHPSFRLFATANTVGLGDSTGLYAGTQQLNQAQMDRWNVVTRLDYLPPEIEIEVVIARCPALDTANGRVTIARMVQLAEHTRIGFRAGDVATLMSPRTVIGWAENLLLFGNLAYAFFVSFLNKCDTTEQPIFAEYYQRCTGETLPESADAALGQP